MKVLFSLIGVSILFVGLSIYLGEYHFGIYFEEYQHKTEDSSVSKGNTPPEQPEIISPPTPVVRPDETILTIGEDLTPIYEGEEAINWLVNFLNDSVNDHQFYFQLVTQDIKYLNATNSTFAIRKFHCGGVCATGAWDNQSKEIMLFNETHGQSEDLSKLHDEQVTFTYLHETGHLVLDRYANGPEMEEWIKIYENIPAEELREYARTTYHEDFADSYALYRLGVLHSQERLEFIKKLEKKAGVIK